MNLNTLSFGEVIRKFENYYGVRITIDNPEDMPELKYHGKIRVSDGVDHALKLLQITNNFSFTRDDETNTIHIKITKKSKPTLWNKPPLPQDTFYAAPPTRPDTVVSAGGR